VTAYRDRLNNGDYHPDKRLAEEEQVKAEAEQEDKPRRSSKRTDQPDDKSE
jgi:hypothetical protein